MKNTIITELIFLSSVIIVFSQKATVVSPNQKINIPI